MSYLSSSSTAGASVTSLAVPVPAGVQTDDIVTVSLYLEANDTVTMPSGFAIKYDLNTNAATNSRLVVMWKRLTGADSGTYTFSVTTAGLFMELAAAAFRGRIQSGDPFLGSPSTVQQGSSTNIVLPSITPAAGDDALVMTGSLDGSTGSTTASGVVTARQNTSGRNLFIGTADNLPNSATAAVTVAVNRTTGGLKGVFTSLAKASEPVLDGRWQLEDGSGNWLLEDGSGYWVTEDFTGSGSAQVQRRTVVTSNPALSRSYTW